MKTRFTATLAMLAGIGVGAFAVQAIHAQSKPPVYLVGGNRCHKFRRLHEGIRPRSCQPRSKHLEDA